MLLTEIIKLEDPAFYQEHQFENYARLRNEAPVFYYEPLDIYVLSKFEDVRNVSRNPEVFSSAFGLTLNELRLARSGVGKSLERFFDPSGELIITVDPPRHRQLRTTFTPAFNPRAVATLEPAIVRFCETLVAEIPEEVPIEFVSSIAAVLPLLVAVEVLGVSEANLDSMQRWVAALEALTGVESEDALVAAANEFSPMNDFFRNELSKKRVSPGDDLMSLLLASTLDGQPLSEAHLLTHLMTLMSNGGTTRLLLTSMAGLLASHPTQLSLLAADHSLIPGAIEESLRFSPPVRGFVRTAIDDVEIREHIVNAGQRVYMLYGAANRDPDIFQNAEEFDVTRRQDMTHLSFGFGTHSCIGAALVRMEADIFFRALLSRFKTFDIVGTPRMQEHVQLNGWEDLRLVFHS